jgi:hypothetical protein
VLTVFGDESCDEKEKRVITVSGIAGTHEEWDVLEIAWTARTWGKIFHAADCEAGRGDFKGISHKENLKLYADLVKMLARTKMIGFAAIVDLKVYNELFPDTVDNEPYNICFRDVVMHFAEIGYLSIPQQKVKFTFDINVKTMTSANELYAYLKSTSDWKYAEYLNDISFAQRNNIGIQAADIIARETMKHYDNIIVGPAKRPVRLSMQELISTNRYTFKYYSTKILSFYKENRERVQEMAGFTTKDYEQWLFNNGLADNIVNRNKFLLHKPDRTKE